MANKLYKYPQSSCICESCPDISVAGYYKPFDNAKPSSLALDNCHEDKLGKCFNSRFVKFDREPKLLKKDGVTKLTEENANITPLNAENLGIVIDETGAINMDCECNDFNGMCFDKNGKSFQSSRQECVNNGHTWKCQNWGCKGNVFIQDDPRTMNYATHEFLALDRPPFNGSVCLQFDKIYSEDLNKIGQPATNYSDLHGGDVTYYVDEQLSQSLFQPNFTIRSNVSKELYIDPMGSKKPHYNREPLTLNHMNVSDYSFDRDQISFREDIMSSNMAQMNQRDYSMWWGNNTN